MDRSVSPQLFVMFAHLIEQVCGVHYVARDRAILASKLETHAFELGHDNLLEYYYLLRYDDPDGRELQRLIEAIVVHETYFFRELPPLIQLVDGHLTEIVHARGRARVWSAACSTGEEPLTMAMLLDERRLLPHVEIVASDVSAAAIARAKAGLHVVRALRDGHPHDLARRHLEVGRHGITVATRIRDAVQFLTANLLDDEAIRALGLFDAIVCRNVLIYFRDEEIVRVVGRLAGSLAPAGLVAVGSAESLIRFGTTLVCEEREGSFFYRRAR